MRNILITGCGGAPSINFVRSLKDAKSKDIRLFGIDSNKYTIHRHECDEAFLCPDSDSNDYIPFIRHFIKNKKIQFLHTQPEKEVYLIGKNREEIRKLGCELFFPKQETIEILRDKYKSYLLWKEANIQVPQNFLIETEKDLKKSFEIFENNIWIRETIGAAGKGSLKKPSYELAKAWINYRNGWGHTVAAKCLSDNTTTWQSIWKNGKLVVGQARDRLYWEMSNRVQSGVTGITGTGKISSKENIAQLAIQCIKVIDPKPNGIFSVDFTYDVNDIPNPTEINIGKFFTTHYFITKAGLNMPEILLQLCFDEYLGDYNVINPITEEKFWIRGMDVEPVMISKDELEKKSQELSHILQNIK
ncbi:MAG: hypothetical protein K940chlam1_00586 [Candidatus Anoxychlamydiales bacterium]|nr:hypothetical protein [Candidatus Anoxychlamydiales bacterium]NGX35511.1 hypothetical protein [Candidatus Anoxychlamydiales bacterium]